MAAGGGGVTVPKEFERYITPTEKVIFSTRRHWITLVPPVAAVVGWVFAIGLIDRMTSPVLTNAAFVIWLLLLLFLAWRMWEWTTEIFLATDRRLVLVYGIIVRKVAMMPMAKVTDMRYDRTIPGKLFGYGVFVLESAGQDQALSVVNFVPQPDMHYQLISQVIFGDGAPTATATSASNRLPITEPDAGWWRR